MDKRYNFYRPLQFVLMLGNAVNDSSVWRLAVDMEMGRGERSMWLYISVQKGDHIDFSEVFDRPLSLEFSDSPDLFWECKALTNDELRGQYESIIAQKVFSRTALIDIMFLRKMLETHPGWVDYSLAAHVRPYNPEEEIKLRKILSL